MRTNATADGANLSAAARPVHDVVVIGGGPAGAAVARGLALRGRDVVLLEATAFDRPRFGETIAPEANPLLRELGVWDEFMNSGPVRSPGNVSAWGSGVPAETDFVGNRHGSGWHVDRNAFDAMLCRAAAAAGAAVHTSARVLRCVRGNSGEDQDSYCIGHPFGERKSQLCGERVWKILTSSGSLEAQFVIDASGRNGIRLEAQDGRTVHDALLAIFVRVAHGEGARADLRTLVESGPDGWWYSAPLPSGEMVAAFLTDPGLYSHGGISLGEQLKCAPLTAARIGAANIVESHVVYVPSSVRAHPAGDGYAAAGDAAAAYDPLSGFGITKAINDANLLAEAIDSALKGDGVPLRRYAGHVHRTFDAYTMQRHEYYAAERRWSERAFWRNRLTARPSRPIASVDEPT